MNKELFSSILGQPQTNQSSWDIPEETVIGQEQINKAIEVLNEYKAGKTALEARVREDELWWKLRHWDAIRKQNDGSPMPVSAYLFNVITNKHADAMDNYPEPIVLPRELSDQQSAKTLSSVLPVILENNGYEDTYSYNWLEKLKHGTAIYGVFYNQEKENGLGDVDIKYIDLLNIFWEPGITDIQQSRNLFIVDIVDKDIMDAQYPGHSSSWGNAIDVGSYIYDENINTKDKVVVVDWYYKVKSPDGRTVLHFVKFCGNELLYASENDPNYSSVGWYADGQYPVVFDSLFPEKGTPVGFGMIAVCKDPQLYIDKLSANVMETSSMASKRRYFVSESTNINEDEFLDWNKPFVHVAGNLEDTKIRPIEASPIDGNTLAVIQERKEEMKDTASNRDVNSGGTGSGVTAAAAISALQEAGNKVSRDMISASYRSYKKMIAMVIERIRQFYDVTRSFRITGEMPGQYEFIQMDNRGLVDQTSMLGGQILYRKPIFDLNIKAQKRNPYNQMVENERAKEFFAMGFFNPQMAQQALLCLEMMEFEGKDKLVEKISNGATLYNMVQMLQNENMQLKAAAGIDPLVGTSPSGQPIPDKGFTGSSPDAAAADAAKTTNYQENLARRSAPSMDSTGNGAAVQ